MTTFKVAAIQAASVLLDRQASTEKACRLIAEAAASGARLAAFGENWLHGYGGYGWTPIDGPEWWAFAAKFNEEAVEIPSATTNQLCAAARENDIDVVIGVVERDSKTRGTLYCTILVIGREGEILGKHRKLKPTGAERVEWGENQNGDSLQVYDRGYAKISALNCWEHFMLLPSFALMAQGTELHIALWPGREPKEVPKAPEAMWPRQHLMSRAFASAGACYVMCVGGYRSLDDIPESGRKWLSTYTGDSAIIDPRGEFIAGPLHDQEGILVADIDMAQVRAAKAIVDNAGHYSRPDVFELRVNGRTVFGNRSAD
jgi:predicted amidohydrolase